MRRKKIFVAILVVTGLYLLGGCVESKHHEPESFSGLALKGKQVFEAKECNQCHYVGDEEVEVGAPDLTHPLLANDSLFVQAHLQFVEESKMPAIKLTDEEMNLLSYFIAGLHAAKHPAASAGEADGRCPVCYAPVSILRAKADKLSVKFLEDAYYFECQDCLATFKETPTVFVELLKEFYIYGGEI